MNTDASSEADFDDLASLRISRGQRPRRVVQTSRSSVKAIDWPKLIKQTIEGFDFNKVAAYLKLINWQWASCGVPAVDNLKGTAFYLLISACNAVDAGLPDAECATGGLHVRVKSDGWMCLRFEIECSEGWPY